MISIKCPICDNKKTQLSFNTLVLEKYNAQFDFCPNCGFIFAKNPFWLEEAYSNSAIASTDTGIVMRNLSISRRLAMLLYLVLKEDGNGRYLDLAGGFGLLTRMMRDLGFDFYWSDKYCENLLAHGFEFTNDLTPFRAVTAFEVMEHLERPLDFIKDSLCFSGTDTFIFSTEVFCEPVPDINSWWYYSFETGQHIAFYQKRTLKFISDRIGLNLYSKSGLYIMTKNKISERVLSFCTNRISYFFIPIINHFMNSLTISDHKMLVKKIRNKI